jgi:hypothetical protein
MRTALFVAISAGVACALLVRWRNKARLATFLQGRAPLSAEAFASLFTTRDEGRVAVSIRELLAPWVAFEVELVRPDDEFCGELLLDAVDGLNPEEFLHTVEKRWSVSILNETAADLRTIRHLSSEVVRRMSGTKSDC